MDKIVEAINTFMKTNDMLKSGFLQEMRTGIDEVQNKINEVLEENKKLKEENAELKKKLEA